MRETREQPGGIALPVRIHVDEVRHFLGLPREHELGERIDSRMRTLLGEARRLVDARGIYRLVSAESAQDLGLGSIPKAQLVLGLVTAGSAIEERASDRIRAGDPVAAMLLDAMGSAAVEEAADHLGATIAAGDGREPSDSVGDEDSPGPAIGCRLSPGYGEWPLCAQAKIFERLPHQRIGVRLSPAMLMLPRKSISFAMFLGADRRPLGLSGCARCKLERCQFRRESPAEGATH